MERVIGIIIMRRVKKN